MIGPKVIRELHRECDEKFWAFVRFKQDVTMAASSCADKMSDTQRAQIKLILRRAGQYIETFKEAPSARTGRGAMNNSIKAIWKALDKLLPKFDGCSDELLQSTLTEIQADCHNIENHYIELLGLVNSAIDFTLKPKG